MNKPQSSFDRKYMGPILGAGAFVLFLCGAVIFFGRKDPELSGKMAAAALLIVMIVLFFLNLVLILLSLLGIQAVDKAQREASGALENANNKVLETVPKVDRVLNGMLSPMNHSMAGKEGLRAALQKLFQK